MWNIPHKSLERIVVRHATATAPIVHRNNTPSNSDWREAKLYDVWRRTGAALLNFHVRQSSSSHPFLVMRRVLDIRASGQHGMQIHVVVIRTTKQFHCGILKQLHIEVRRDRHSEWRTMTDQSKIIYLVGYSKCCYSLAACSCINSQTIIQFLEYK